MKKKRLLYLAAFVALALVAAITVDRIVQPRMFESILLAACLGVVVGMPGLLHHRVAPVSVVLLPLGLYLLFRLISPLPEDLPGGLQHQLSHYGEELRFGVAAYKDDIFPLSISAVPGLKLLMLTWVYVLVALSSVLTLGCDRPVAGAATLLALLGLTLTVDESNRDPWIISIYLVLVVLALLTSQSLSRKKWGIRDALAGLLVGGAGLVVGLALMTGAPSLATQGWQDWRSWDFFGRDSSTQILFNWKQNYPRLLDPGNKFPIMQVTSALPSYWKANTLDEFTGDAWVSNNRYELILPDGPGATPIDQHEPLPPGTETLQSFRLQSVFTNYLFSSGYPSSLRIDTDIPVFLTDNGVLRLERTLDPPASYDVTALIPRIEPEDLVSKGRDYPRDIRERYMSLPLPSVADVKALQQAGADWKQAVLSSPATHAREYLDLYSLSDKMIGDATDPYEQALRIEGYLKTWYQYSLQPPRSEFMSPFASFLLDTRVGYCQHFAGAMALLLRLNEVPARIAVGFVTGEKIGTQTYQVSSNNAHSWVEVYFPGVGWVPFDPTRGRTMPLAGASSSSPGFVNPFIVPGQTDAAADSEPPTPGALPPEEADFVQEEEQASGTTTEGGSGITAVLGLVAALALLASWPFLRTQVRERGLRHGSQDSRFRASLRLLYGDLDDWGETVPDSYTLEETALAVHDELNVDIAPLLRPAQGLLFGGRSVSRTDVELAERLRRRVRYRLRRHRPWYWTVAAWFGLSGLLKIWRFRRHHVAAPHLPMRTTAAARTKGRG